MKLDLVKVKQWIIDAVKRAACGDAYMPQHDAETAFEMIDHLNAAIDTGDFTYVDVEVPNGDDLRISQQEWDEIQAELDQGRKIQAIKLLRTFSGCGLKDAKYAVENPYNWTWTRYREINCRPGSMDPMCK